VVVADLFSLSGRDMMRALIGGQRDPKVLAQLARSGMRSKIGLLEEAFVGQFTDHHAYLLGKMLDRVEAAEADITDIGDLGLGEHDPRIPQCGSLAGSSEVRTPFGDDGPR
jgi:hypothetical protein